MNRKFITLHSSLLDGLTDDELLYVLWHELGLIKCGNVRLSHWKLSPMDTSRAGRYFCWLRQGR